MPAAPAVSQPCSHPEYEDALTVTLPAKVLVEEVAAEVIPRTRFRPSFRLLAQPSASCRPPLLGLGRATDRFSVLLVPFERPSSWLRTLASWANRSCQFLR